MTGRIIEPGLKTSVSYTIAEQQEIPRENTIV